MFENSLGISRVVVDLFKGLLDFGWERRDVDFSFSAPGKLMFINLPSLGWG